MAMMADNIFVKIVRGEIPAQEVHRDEHCVVFHDINPAAPTHLLVIPAKEIRTHADVADDDVELMGRLHLAARDAAKKLGLTDYRLVINCGEGAGQSVPHLHLHVLGGRRLEWPPG